MHFSTAVTALATVLTLVTQGSSYVIDVYDSDNCSGGSREVNVWDNTCATWMGGFKSYKPKVYGGPHQKAYFFVPGNCGDLTTSFGGHWADGGDGDFQAGRCMNFGSNRVVNAASSYRG
ncbi:uncharacterized protein K460DRAFT_40 [Cucurbitaria berberidis CBS 394.84]|uniref:Small secreted protein n=1 Tax=Cucurbitaria berberidis CBS 394.84 TaxID=1168544 RepID=A0A9P4GQN7_9PLEO|nr:uncharacterized protein K460DRAFT_40 [Cucurbitaria berberidis CBS 394.84]KAF1849567.1 hypothetical protein K460DRAFT_40 [Cucurbitaria berberidis CBS 394.84]